MRGDARYIKLFGALLLLIPLVMLTLRYGSAAVTPKESDGPPAPQSVSLSSHVSLPFADDIEDPNAGFWVTDPTWGTTTDDFLSPSTSWTDSSAGYYANDVDSSLTLASPIDLSAASSPVLKFWHHYRLESGFDFGYVEVSTAGASGPWTAIATYSGSVTSPYTGGAPSAAAKSDSSGFAATDALLSTPGEPWVLEQLSLAAYAGQAAVLVRFRIATDGSVVDDGWYVDDIAIDELLAAVTLIFQHHQHQVLS